MAWWVWIGLALAQDTTDVSAARLCAEAAQGKEVDVCVALAAEHPDQVAGIAAALRGHVDRAAEDDRELLQALLLLLDDETGVQGARRLGELGDQRAVGPLAHAGRHRTEAVAVAAVEALSHYGEGLGPLSRWVGERELPLEVRMAAAQALGDLGRPEGADVLITTLRRRGVPARLRQTVLEVLETHFPERAGELEHQVSQDGTVWLAAGGAAALGYGLAMAGHLGRADLAGLGGVTGAAAGGTAGWVAGSAWPMEASDAAFLTTTGVLGGAGGVLIGASLGEGPRSADGAWVGGLVGETLGFGLGFALRQEHRGDVGDAWEASLVSSASALALGTGVDFAAGWRGAGGRGPLLATGLGLLGGAAVGHAVAPGIAVSRDDALMMGLAGIYGTYVGAVAPVPADRRGLPMTGLAAGALGGYALSGFVDPRSDVTAGGAAGLSYGAVFGAGLGMVVDPLDASSGDAIRGLSLSAGTLGLVGGAWAAARNPEPVNSQDVVLVSLVTGWSTWQAVGWYGRLLTPPWVDGLFVMAPPALGAATAAATPWLDVPVSYSFGGLSMGLWGAYLGGVTARLVDARGSEVLPYVLVGSDLGLAAGIALAAPPLSMPPLVLGLADAGGVLGGSVFALGASFFVDPRAPGGVDTILTASLAGVVTGFVGGALLGGVLHRSGTTRDIALVTPAIPGRWSLAPAAFPGESTVHYGARLQVTEW